LQIAGRKIVARDQHDRLVGHQRDRLEIGRCVVKRLLIERLVLRVGAEASQYELVTVGCGFGDAVCASHAAGSADVFNHDRLAELDAQAFRQDPRNRIGGAASGKWRDHGQRLAWIVLGLRGAVPNTDDHRDDRNDRYRQASLSHSRAPGIGQP
jgi:hypothetical protein